jgi:hypothetical protein
MERAFDQELLQKNLRLRNKKAQTHLFYLETFKIIT